MFPMATYARNGLLLLYEVLQAWKTVNGFVEQKKGLVSSEVDSSGRGMLCT